MLDRRFVLDNLDLVEQNISDRRSRPVDLSQFRALEQEHNAKEQRLVQVRTEANTVSKQRSPEGIERGRALRAEEKQLRADVADLRGRSDELLRSIPNLTHPKTPLGDEADSQEIARSAVPPPRFEFPVKDHVDLGADLGIIDLAAGSRVAGAGFYFLQGEGALLEFALQQFALDRLMAHGFVPQVVPELVRDEIMAGAGYAPRGDESNSYHLENSDLNLIATSEIALCGRYADEIVPAEQLPIKLCGVSHCFRTERAYGRATRGLFRVHQFSKVEMVILCRPDDSEEMHSLLLDIEREVFDDLGLPYRVLEIASGDLGAPAYRKFDIEAWMPGRGDAGEYAEVTSASNCLEYQARRLNIRYRTEGESRRDYVHTLNGTGIAVGRAMIAILENGQRPDGTIEVPERLRPYLGGRAEITGQLMR